MQSQALYFLSERYPSVLLLARPLLAFHASCNGCAVGLLGAALDDLTPDFDPSTWLFRMDVCEECPGDSCAPGCRFRAVQTYIDDAEALQREYTKRQTAFSMLPVDSEPYMGNPLRAVFGSRGTSRTSGHTLSYAQNMQCMCEARDKLCLHNKKTNDPEQQQFNGDVINLISAMLRTMDRHTRDILRQDEDAKVYANYRICSGLWDDGETPFCHSWGEPTVFPTAAQVDAKFSARVKASATPKAARTSAKKRKASSPTEDDGDENESPPPKKKRSLPTPKTKKTRSSRSKSKK
jgi:hypothetical protein